MSLHWLTDEGTEIEPVTEISKSDRPGPWRWMILLLLLAFTTLGFIYYRQMRQVQAQEQMLAEEVAAGFQVWQEAILSGDEDLFITLLATWDPAWQRSQKQLFAAGRLLDRTALGLPSTIPYTNTITHIDIAPDWQSAVVEARRPYEVFGENGKIVTVQLTHTFHYARNGFRWLASAPEADFWGERETLSGRRVNISVPGRDARLAQRILHDLERDLGNLCADLAAVGTPCPTGSTIQIYFDDDPQTLLNLPNGHTPLFRGETYLLPTPTLVGLPKDDQAYQALYAGYTNRIQQTVEHNQRVPLPFPNQKIASLCFPAGGHTMKLFTVDPVEPVWAMHLPDHNFRYLSPTPDGSSVILQEYGREFQPNHLRLLEWQEGREIVLYDATNSSRLPRPVGWAGPVDDAHLLVHSIVLNRADIYYNQMDREKCTEDGCPLRTLPGYTVWSPDGRTTLVTRRGDIYLGDSEGNLLTELETGFNPFWLDDHTYGYAHYVYPEGNRPVVEIVTGDLPLDDNQEVTRLLSSTDIPDDNGNEQVFIDFIAPLPDRPGELFISGPKLGSDRYVGFRVPAGKASPETIRQVLDLPDRLRGHPGLITPTGYPPFGFSPNGRWLIGSIYHETPVPGWTLYLHDLESDKTKEYPADYPTYPAQYPFYDWSADGNWLLVVDDGFLRLIAPAHDYERLLPHPHDNCFFSAWISE